MHAKSAECIYYQHVHADSAECVDCYLSCKTCGQHKCSVAASASGLRFLQVVGQLPRVASAAFARIRPTQGVNYHVDEGHGNLQLPVGAVHLHMCSLANCAEI